MDVSKIKLFSTHEHACSYLEDQMATTLFVDPTLQMDGKLYSELSDLGFRRSGQHLYRPRCRACQACIPVRIPVEEFQLSRSQKRCLKKNQDVRVHWTDSIASDEHYALYERYINERHSDGDMYPPNREQYDEFLTSEWGVTRFIEMRLGGTLIAVAVSDRLEQGLSAIYTYYDPSLPSRSLGVFAILKQIEHCRELGLPFVYLGYWIRDCDKMNYKTQYRPLQMLFQQSWLTLR